MILSGDADLLATSCSSTGPATRAADRCDDGKVHKAHLFVAALDFLGGVMKVVVRDNLKASVTKLPLLQEAKPAATSSDVRTNMAWLGSPGRSSK